MQNNNLPNVKVPKEQRKVFVLMYTLFFALIIWNLTNYLSFAWISDNWTTGRQMVNYMVWPFLLWLFSGDIFHDIPSEKVYIKSKILNYIFITIFMVIVYIFCNLNISFEEEKNLCLKEQTKDNLMKCIKEKEDIRNRFNITKIF